MYTYQGIAVDTWTKIEGGCPIKCEVIGDEAQFEIGNRAVALNLVATEQGLTSLVIASLEALSTLRENHAALTVEPDTSDG